MGASVQAILHAAPRKARDLSLRDWWRIALGQIALVRAWIDVKTRPQGELVRRTEQPTTQAPVEPSHRAAAELVALGVRRAGAYGLFSPTCLVRSLAICRRLAAEGVSGGTVRVGVARKRGAFAAHAWVEFAGEVIGEDDGVVDGYTPFDDLDVTTRP